MSPSEAQGHSRREFLIRAGVIGAAMVFIDVGELEFASSSAEGAALSPTALAPLFEALATDTISGLVAFVVPGPDAYSVAQGVSDAAPGGLAADGVAFMLNALDNFYPVPQEPLRLLAQSLVTGINANLPTALPLVSELPGLAEQLDLALAAILSPADNLPLSLPVALLLNFLATLVNPAAVNGIFLSPFSRLDFTEKTQAFALLEGEASMVAGVLDANLTEPLKDTLSGLLEFLAGALVEFAAFGSFSEFGMFDSSTNALNGTPVGWQLTQYLALAPNQRPVENWDEFKGYLGGISQVSE
jgi:hypothetical protein